MILRATIKKKAPFQAGQRNYFPITNIDQKERGYANVRIF